MLPTLELREARIGWAVALAMSLATVKLEIFPTGSERDHCPRLKSPADFRREVLSDRKAARALKTEGTPHLGESGSPRMALVPLAGSSRNDQCRNAHPLLLKWTRSGD